MFYKCEVCGSKKCCCADWWKRQELTRLLAEAETAGDAKGVASLKRKLARV